MVIAALPFACSSSDDKPGGNVSDGGAGDAPSGAGGAGGGALTTFNRCPARTRLGGFVLQVTDQYAGVEGRVNDIPNPIVREVPVGAMVDGCQLMKRPDPVPPCSPMCNPGTHECTPNGCVALPQSVGVGQVTLTGLVQPMTLKFEPTVKTYINPPEQMTPYPLWGPGAAIQLNAAGMGAYPAFSLKGFGVQPVVVPAGKLSAARGMPVTVTWTAVTNPGPSKMKLDFSVNRHGATDSWIECFVDDDGSYTIGAALVEELFKLGTSGYPDVTLTRMSSDTVTVNGGCVDLEVYSTNSRELDVPGINSCRDDTDCTPPNVCGVTRDCRPPQP